MTSSESSRRKGARRHCSGRLRVSFTLSRVITTFWTRLSLTPVCQFRLFSVFWHHNSLPGSTVYILKGKVVHHWLSM